MQPRPEASYHQQPGPVPRTLGTYIEAAWPGSSTNIDYSWPPNNTMTTGQTGQAGGKQSGGKGKSPPQGQVAQIVQQHVPEHMYQAAYGTEPHDDDEYQDEQSQQEDERDEPTWRPNLPPHQARQKPTNAFQATF